MQIKDLQSQRILRVGRLTANIQYFNLGLKCDGRTDERTNEQTNEQTEKLYTPQQKLAGYKKFTPKTTPMDAK